MIRNFTDIDFSSILADSYENDPFTNEVTPTPYELHDIKCEYWETVKLRDYLSPIESNTSYLHLNIQCLPAKFDSFVSFLNTLTDRKETNFPSVIALSETWLNASNCSLYDINGYHSFLSNNRTDNSSR